ncbi:MAG: Wzz/FepE/Etk N-terminal domain-containing protein [bacterium]|nr:Wzz/FepE/Etk N-terminal domain-containing protein [bacterium]
MNSEQDVNEIDLIEMLHILRRRLVIIISVTVIFGLAGALVSYYMIEPKYASISKIYVMSKSDASFSLSDLDLSTGLTADYAELIKSRTVMEQVIKDLHLTMDYDELLSLVTITNPKDTRMLSIKVTYTDPVLAKEIANDIVAVSQKSIKDIMHTDEPSVVEPAISTGQKVSPNITKNTLLATLLGLFISCGIIIVGYLLDDTVKTADDVERYLGLNTLGMIPDEDEKKRNSKKKKNKGKKKSKEEYAGEIQVLEEKVEEKIEEEKAEERAFEETVEKEKGEGKTEKKVKEETIEEKTEEVKTEEKTIEEKDKEGKEEDRIEEKAKEETIEVKTEERTEEKAEDKATDEKTEHDGKTVEKTSEEEKIMEERAEKPALEEISKEEILSKGEEEAVQEIAAEQEPVHTEGKEE